MRQFLTTVLCCLLAACTASEQKEFHGNLYFASGSHVGRFDLRDGSSSIVANIGDVRINSISAAASQELLLSMVSFVGDREIPRISSLDVRTGDARDLFAGSNAVYVETAASVVYNDGTRLAEASLRGRSKSNFADAAHRYGASVDLLVINGDAVLFSNDENEQPRIHYLNLITGESQNLVRLAATCDLDGAVWISSVERLACKHKDRSVGDQAYLLVSLDGTQQESLDLPPGKNMLALTYVEKQDLLILAERRETLFGGRNKWSVWGHDLSTGNNHELSRNQYLGSSVVYMDF